MGRTVIDVLKRVPLFAELSAKELHAIAEQVTLHAYEHGSTVFRQGEPCREFLIVGAGAVRLVKTAASGREQLMSVERMGSTLAEAPVFDGGEYSATAQACEPTSVLRIGAEEFRRICRAYPAVAEKLIRVLGYRLRHLENLVEELSFSTVRARLAAHLARLAEERGRQTLGGLQFRLDENNEDLAARLGTVRELISRNLGRLYGENLIHMKGRVLPRFGSASSLRDGGTKMPYVIGTACVGVKDTACLDVCPVDCIHPRKDEPGFVGARKLSIYPENCICCGACVPVCPVGAIDFIQA